MEIVVITQKNPTLLRGAAFGWAALVSCSLLLIPFIAMQFSQEIRWSPADFAVMGLLIFGMCSIFIISARLLQRRYWAAAAITCSAMFLLVWAELAVGVFTSIGS